MTQDYANKVLAFIESNKQKVEKAIVEVLDIKVNLQFEVKGSRMQRYRIDCYDIENDMNEQMTATPLLKQLFSMAQLRVDVWPNSDKEEMGVFFNVGVAYIHNYRGGCNGHDLMAVCLDKDGNISIGK